MISDCLKHDSILVHTFQRHLLKFIENTFQSALKKKFFSDGSVAQHENRKNAQNITCHNEGFGVPAEWYSLRHPMESACYGVGGTLKRLAAKASLQRPYNDQIMTPHQLYEWAQSSILNLNFYFVTENEYREEEGLLSSRFATAETVRGTQQLHAFMR
jgi:hypothetical protein